MAELCTNGSEPKPGSPPTFNLTTGVVCATFGVTHPICNLVDQILPDLFPGIPFEARMGKAMKKLLKVGGIVSDILNSLPDPDIPTAEFCSVEPVLPTEDISYADVFLAFSGIYPDALLEKVATYMAYEKWFELCRCKPDPEPTEPDEQPPDPTFPPLPTPIPEPPDGCCKQRFQSFMEEVVTFSEQQFQNQLDEAISRGGVSFPYGGATPRLGGQFDLPGCINEEPGYKHQECFCRIYVSKHWEVVWGVLDANGQEVIGSLGTPMFLSKNVGITYYFDPRCLPKQPLPDPEGEPGDLLDPDFLEDGCDIFPDASVCQGRGGCELESTTVQVQDGCGNPPRTVTVALLRQVEEEPPPDVPGCTDPLATNYNPLATVDDGSCFYGSFDWGFEANLAFSRGASDGNQNPCGRRDELREAYIDEKGYEAAPDYTQDNHDVDIISNYNSGYELNCQQE